MIPESTLHAIESRFHELIRERAGRLIDEHSVELPRLRDLLASEKNRAWFPVPGMYGGFVYRLRGDGEEAVLMTESWCRVVEGSGQRHRITADETVLVEKGFV